MYKKYLIIASKLDKAGINITTQLSQFRKNPLITSMNNSPSFDFYLCDKEIIYTENLNLEKINQYDFIIFASKHESVKKQKTLSIHAPGNWRQNELGGEKRKVCKTSALFQKQTFEKLNKNAKEHNLQDYNITLECTHHGPLIEKPCIFIEIGATQTEWQDRKAGFVIAKTIRDIIQNFKENPYNEIAIGIGGPHYCPNFNKIQLNSNIAISHVIPQYVLPLTEEMIHQALNKTEEEVDFVVLDWKGIGNSEQRKQLLEILDKNYIRYKRTSEIEK
ncbi:MAG: D-aminoacyl-tRNA deacylase [Nanoarchaeota archaeon]